MRYNSPMNAVKIPVDEKWMAAVGVSPKELERDFRGILAARLFELRRVTLAQAAAMADLNVWEFLEYLLNVILGTVNCHHDYTFHHKRPEKPRFVGKKSCERRTGGDPCWQPRRSSASGGSRS